MTAAWHEVSATSKVVADFVAKFVQVIVLQSDNIRPKFSSVSTGSYIGLVIIRNPHSENVSDTGLAEVMVHEAIHALLFYGASHKTVGC